MFGQQFYNAEKQAQTAVSVSNSVFLQLGEENREGGVNTERERRC